MMSTATMPAEQEKEEKSDPFANLDGRQASVIGEDGTILVKSLEDADEALVFLENHPTSLEVAEAGSAILEDPVQLKRLVRKIDFTIAPLLAAVYFLQFLDKTTLSYTAVMGIRTDTHLKGQDYSDLSMLFYIGMQRPSASVSALRPHKDRQSGQNSLLINFAGFLVAEFPTQYLAQHLSRLGLYLGINIMIWGLILGFHASCTTFAGLAVARTLLGVFESWYVLSEDDFIPLQWTLTFKIVSLQFWY